MILICIIRSAISGGPWQRGGGEGVPLNKCQPFHLFRGEGVTDLTDIPFQQNLFAVGIFVFN